MGAPCLRVVVAEDEPSLSFAVRALIDIETALEVVSVVSTGDCAVDAVRALRPDVVLLDVRLGAPDGIESAAAIHRSFPETGVVIYTGDEGELARARAAGFQHVLLKGAIGDDLIAALEAAAG